MTVMVHHNNRSVEGSIVDPQPTGLASYEVRVNTAVFGEITVAKSNVDHLVAVGEHVKLACNGIPGMGGLNRHFLFEQGYNGDAVEVTQEIGQHRGQVKLPSGHLLDVSLKDIIR